MRQNRREATVVPDCGLKKMLSDAEGNATQDDPSRQPDTDGVTAFSASQTLSGGLVGKLWPVSCIRPVGHFHRPVTGFLNLHKLQQMAGER